MKYLLILTLLMLPALVVSCDKPEQDDRSQADELFAETVTLVRAYTDSLRLASDTASVARITENYELAVSKLNLGYPPETDMKLTEGQQDSIWRFTRKFLEVKKARIRHLVNHKTDSVAADSVANGKQKI